MCNSLTDYDEYEPEEQNKIKGGNMILLSAILTTGYLLIAFNFPQYAYLFGAGLGAIFIAFCIWVARHSKRVEDDKRTVG